MAVKPITNKQIVSTEKINRANQASTKDINHLDRKINKINSELPSKIRNVVGHIEFAKPLDNK